MSKIPFYLGNLAACFVPGSDRRAHCRAYVNLFFYYPTITRFIRRAFGEKTHSVKFIRQRTLNRVVCLVNDKYYVKIFRDVTPSRIRDFAFLANYVADRLDVTVPRVIPNDRASMYATPRVAGNHILDMDRTAVLAHDQQIQTQMFDIIDQLQSIDIAQIPHPERFVTAMQERTVEDPITPPQPVLAHFDLNEENIFLDDDFNICAVIDWDGLSIANNPDTDKRIFLKYWNRYKNRK